MRPGRKPGKPQTPWTDEEVGELLDLDDLSAREIGKILGRSASSVQAKRYKLRSGWEQEREFISDEERDIVRSTPNLTAAQVARQLGRSEVSVQNIRRKLTQTEGIDYGSGQRKSPYEVGTRRLVAKTCTRCGLLLEANRFVLQTAKGKARNWRPDCTRCNNQANAANPESARASAPTGWARDRGASSMRSLYRLNAMTRERATRHGKPWLESDHGVLRDADLTNLEKALQLGRTYAATKTAVQKNGYTSRVMRGDPVKGQWVIDNPNAPQFEEAAA